MAKRTVLLTFELTPYAVTLARQKGVDLIAYEKPVSDGNLPHDIPAEQITMDRDLLVHRRERTREAVDAFCRTRTHQLIAPFHRIGIDEESSFDFITQSLARDLEDDYRLVLLGRTFYPEDRVIYVLADAVLARQVTNLSEVFQAPRPNRRKQLLRNLLKPLLVTLLFFKVWLFGDKKRKSSHLIFEQTYPMYEDNNEFLFFYEWLRKRSLDVLYLVEKRSWKLASVLAEQKQNVTAQNELKLPPGQAVTFILEWVRLLLWLSRSPLPFAATSHHLDLLFHYIRGAALLETYDFRYYLKIRGDMDLHSAALRRLLNRHNVRMIAYSHGTFWDRAPRWSRVHSDFYGYSSQKELEDFRGALMPSGREYILAGQMSVENPVDPKRIERVRISHADRGIGIYPTTANHWETGLKEKDLRSFIEVSLRCASRYSKGCVIFKHKELDGEMSEALRHAEDAYGLRILTAHHSESSRYQYKLTAVETYQLVDFGLVFSITTCGFELLALQKRVLVYEPFPETHPFERHTPLLVASDPLTFEEHFDRLSGMSDAEYRAYIRPTLEFCGKKADGRLVESFFQSIPGLDTASASSKSLVGVH